MATVREVFFEVMRELGLTTVFGNPGSTEEDFLANFPPDFHYVLGLQEASVLAMADGYSQATGKPAFVNLHTAPGLGNAIGNLVTAKMNKTPLIVTAGQQTREMLLLEPWLTNVEPTKLAEPNVKWAYQPVRPQDVPAALIRAYSMATLPPQGPVFLSLPLDDWSKTADTYPLVRRVSQKVGADPDFLNAVADELENAINPAIIAGADIDRAGAWDLAVTFAERIGATVFSPPASERAGFPESHSQYAGTLPFAIGPLAEKLKGFDVVVVIGAPVFRYYPYVPGDYLPEGTRLFHITDDPSEAARAPVGVSIISDAKLALRELLRIVAKKDRAAPSCYKPPVPPAESKVMTAAGLFYAIAKVRPDDAIIVEESPSNLAMIRKYLPTTNPASFFTMASGGLGFGLPAAVGISLAERDMQKRRPIIAIIGDGSFNYSIQALASAADERIKLIVIVPRNKEYAILKAFAKQQNTPGVPGLDLPEFDLPALARAYGCQAFTASDPEQVCSYFQAALLYDGPTIIEAIIDPEVPELL